MNANEFAFHEAPTVACINARTNDDKPIIRILMHTEILPRSTPFLKNHEICMRVIVRGRVGMDYFDGRGRGVRRT